jgi:hypothetical protein
LRAFLPRTGGTARLFFKSPVLQRRDNGGKVAEIATEVSVGEQQTPDRWPRLRRWLRRLAVALLVLGLLYFCRAPLLQGMAGLLIVAEPVPAQTDFVLLFAGHDLYDRAAEIYRTSSHCPVVVIQLTPRRLESLGIVPSYQRVARRELGRRGVEQNSVIVLSGEGRTDWDRARCLGTWLREHPDAQGTMLCGRLGSRRKRIILDRVLGDATAQLHLQTVPHPWYDESNWWQNRAGILEFWGELVGLLYAHCCGDTSAEYHVWDLEAFERDLGEAP